MMPLVKALQSLEVHRLDREMARMERETTRMITAADGPPQCPICMEPYDAGFYRPKLLNCGNGHSLCAMCLARLIETRPGNLRCPQCQGTVRCLRVTDLPSNIDLMNAVAHMTLGRGGSDAASSHDKMTTVRCATCNEAGNENRYRICVTCASELNEEFDPLSPTLNVKQLTDVTFCPHCILMYHKDHTSHTIMPYRLRIKRDERGELVAKFDRVSAAVEEKITKLTDACKDLKMEVDLHVNQGGRNSSDLDRIEREFERKIKRSVAAMHTVEKGLNKAAQVLESELNHSHKDSAVTCSARQLSFEATINEDNETTLHVTNRGEHRVIVLLSSVPNALLVEVGETKASRPFKPGTHSIRCGVKYRWSSCLVPDGVEVNDVVAYYESAKNLFGEIIELAPIKCSNSAAERRIHQQQYVPPATPTAPPRAAKQSAAADTPTTEEAD